MPRYLAEPKQPFREMLQALTGCRPPAFVKGYGIVNFTDNQIMALQDWCSLHVKPNWATGIGLMEAAEKMVEVTGACVVHPAEACRVEWVDGMHAVCSKCPRRISLCGATRYMAPCYLEKGHEGPHLDEKHNSWWSP